MKYFILSVLGGPAVTSASKSPLGAIIGGLTGGLVALAVVVAVLVYIFVKKRRYVLSTER